MTETPTDYGSKEYRQMMNVIFGDLYFQINDFLGQDGFYGVINKQGIAFFAEKLNLSKMSHVLDVGCGVGGPARFLAKNYGCKVTGIDISEYNHEKAVEKTKEAGIEYLVDFVHGNGLDMPFPDSSFTHAIGCDAWCYFPDKTQLYKAVHRVLKPQGIIAFLEGAHETPKHYHFEKINGPTYYESINGYTSKLEAAGFGSVQYFDVLEQSWNDQIDCIYKLITKRKEFQNTFGSPAYYASVEYWAELLALSAKGIVHHVCFIARSV